VRLSMTFNKTDSLEARRELQELFDKFGTTTVFVNQRHVSRSGMTRYLDLYLLPSYDKAFFWSQSPLLILAGTQSQIEPRRITLLIAKALQWPYHKERETLIVSGCGMDMHFHTVYSLSCLLYCNKHYDHEKAYYLKHQTI